MRSQFTAIFIALSLTTASSGQVPVPTVVSSKPSIHLFSPDGVIHYAVTFSEIFETGSAIPGGNAYLTTVSGDLSYLSASKTHPFSLLYAGGWHGSTDPALPSAPFHNLAVTQTFNVSRWIANISNRFSYLPQTPSIGLSGIPGLGDVGLQASQPKAGPPPTLLNNYGSLLDETLAGDLSRRLDHATNLTGTASWGERYFITGAGLNTVQFGASVGIDRRLSPRSNAGLNYTYSRFSYGGTGFAFHSDGLDVTGKHQWTRAFLTSVAIGPQWIGSSDAGAIPSRAALATTASATYSRRLRSATISYTRGVIGGSGVLPGAFSNSIQAVAQEAFGRTWALSGTGTYTNVSSLASTNSSGKDVASVGTGTSKYFSVQATRAFGRSLNLYLSYSAQSQSLDQSLDARNPFSGVSHVVGTGISFSPQSKHFGQL